MQGKTDSQLSENARAELIHQGYRVVGNHSAVKICGWTKSMIRGLGGCYKLTFYGVMSHQCMQMTSSISCANRCTFCWRGYKAPVSKDWKWGVDEPLEIADGCLAAHWKLLTGFGGSSPAMFKQAETVKHAALSLTGEPITYPRINELIDELHAKGISTFLVTNAQYPQAIADLRKVTQLYVSVDAPNKELLKKVDVPLFEDYWERLNESLDIVAKRNDRTTVRLTVIKGINDIEPENYAKLIKKADADFIEIKGYVFVGPSRQRLQKENMPHHEEVIDFAKKVAAFLDEYEFVSEHVASAVVLLAKKKYEIDNKWQTWIDYPKFFKLLKSKDEFLPTDFLLPTPQTGLSGMTTQEYFVKIRNRRNQRKVR